MKIISVIHDIFRKTALTHLWIVSAFYLFIAIDGTKLATGMQSGQYFCIFLFSLCVTFSRYTLKLTAIPFAARVAIQFITLLIAFFLIFGVSGNVSLGNPVPFIIAFVLIYTVVMLVSTVISEKISKKTEAESSNASKRKDNYQSMF